MLVLNGEDVRASLPMKDAVVAVREAVEALARGCAYQPPDVVFQPPAVSGVAVLKPAHVQAGRSAFGFKAATLFSGNADRGLDAVQGFVVLLDENTGVPLALLEGGAITEIRTAAMSAVATDLLARPDAGDLAVIGAGSQARGHLMAMPEVRDLRRVRVWNRTPERAARLKDWAANRGMHVEVMGSIPAAVEGADLVCTVTSARDPLVEGHWLASGAHINAVGAFQPDTRELHSDVVTRADVIVVDSRASAMTKAGDLLIPQGEGALGDRFDPIELGELITGRRSGRGGAGEVTLFKSVGLAVQDLASAALAYERARQQGHGADVSFP